MTDLPADFKRTFDPVNNKLWSNYANANEIEYTIYSYSQKNPAHGVIFFDKLSKVLKNIYGQPKINYQLVISHGKEPERVLINDFKNIQKFCQTEQLDEESALIQRKIVVFRTDKDSPINKEYGVRLRMSQETEIGQMFKEVASWVQDATTEKTYRYRKRYSYHDEDNIRFDLSVTKIGVGTSFRNAEKNNQPLFNTTESYDIELDWSASEPLSKEDDFNQVFNRLNIKLYQILQIRENSPILMSRTNAQKILKSYNDLIREPKQKQRASLESIKFIGANVYPLSLQNVLNPERYPQYKNTNIILSNYVYTYKTDGERHLLFFDSEGQAYLIDMNFLVKKVDYQTDKYQNSLFDCELYYDGPQDSLLTGKFFQIWVFDAFFLSGKNLLDLPLFSDDDSRLDAIGELIDFANENESNSRFFTIKEKAYYQDFEELLQAREKLPFTYDGLVLTDYTKAYPRTFDAEQKFAFKVKNLEQLTIDFLVKKSQIDERRSLDDDQTKITYQKFDLLVRDNRRATIFYPDNLNVIGGSNYAFVNYQTQLEADQITQSMRTREDNFPIYENFVYECSFIKSKIIVESDGKVVDASGQTTNTTGEASNFFNGWHLMRHRPIKTRQARPNAFQTANTTWDMILNLIQNPERISSADIESDKYIIAEITEDALLFLIKAATQQGTDLQTLINEKVDQPANYYNSGLQSFYDQLKQNYPLIKPLKQMHNQIKSLLYDRVCKEILSKKQTKEINLLELASGTGGDYQKWINSGVTRVVGLEIDRQQIREAESRIAGQRTKSNIKVDYIWADMLKPLASAGKTPVAQAEINRIFKKSNQFDLVSCQFAIHFALCNEFDFRTMLKNISNNLKKGGYFIGTGFIAQRTSEETQDPDIGPGVFQALQDNNGELSYVNEGQEIWKIQRKYEQEQVLDFGQTIDVFLISLHNQAVTECLVNLLSERIRTIAREYNLSLVQVANLGQSDAPQAFGEVYRQIEHGQIEAIALGRDSKPLEDLAALKANQPLMQFSRFNSLFIFQKV